MSFPPTATNIARALALIPPIFRQLSSTDADGVTHRNIRRALVAKLIEDGEMNEIEGVFEGSGDEAMRWKAVLREEVQRCVDQQEGAEEVSPDGSRRGKRCELAQELTLCRTYRAGLAERQGASSPVKTKPERKSAASTKAAASKTSTKRPAKKEEDDEGELDASQEDDHPNPPPAKGKRNSTARYADPDDEDKSDEEVELEVSSTGARSVLAKASRGTATSHLAEERVSSHVRLTSLDPHPPLVCGSHSRPSVPSHLRHQPRRSSGASRPRRRNLSRTRALGRA